MTLPHINNVAILLHHYKDDFSHCCPIICSRKPHCNNKSAIITLLTATSLAATIPLGLEWFCNFCKIKLLNFYFHSKILTDLLHHDLLLSSHTKCVCYHANNENAMALQVQSKPKCTFPFSPWYYAIIYTESFCTVCTKIGISALSLNLAMSPYCLPANNKSKPVLCLQGSNISTHHFYVDIWFGLYMKH